MESLADFICKNKSLTEDKEKLYKALISDSSYHIDNDSKMSSGMDDLCVKMSLTPKIISYAREFSEEVDAVASGLIGLGLEPGARVAIYSDRKSVV